MEITIKKTTEKKVKIELPLYRIGGCHAYKVYSEEKCIQVCNLKGNLEIGQHHAGLAWITYDTKDCSREKFEEMYQKVSSEIAKFL